MMNLLVPVCSVMNKKSFYISLVSLLLISGVCGQGNMLAHTHVYIQFMFSNIYEITGISIYCLVIRIIILIYPFIVTPTITLSSTIQSDTTTFPITDGNANIPILTKNVILEANIPGTWEGKQSSTTNTISFSIFTLVLAGSYTFTAAEGGNAALTVQIDLSVSGK